MKNMSFGKLMAIFGGSLVVVIILAVVIIKATSGPKPGSTVVTQRHQTQFQPQQPDILAEQLRREQEASAAAREMSAQQSQAMQQALQQQNQAVMQRLDGIAIGLNALDQRVAAIENSRRPTGVQVIKPERKPRTSPVKQLEKGLRRFRPTPATRCRPLSASVLGSPLASTRTAFPWARRCLR
ncbi:hypothetical protein C0073_022205 (plasmid) [Aeromonas veronii]|nr:hypothetical protein C0073_022205 [Aeromonas veronii]